MKGIKQDLQRVNELLNKLENGELEINELMILVDASRALYEKSVVLQYKAFENNGPVKLAQQEEVIESKPEITEEQTPINAEPEEPVFDFGMFEETDDEPSIEEPAMSEAIVENVSVSPADETPEPEIEEHISITSHEEESEGVKVEEVSSVHTKTTFYDKLSQQDNSLAAQLAGGKLSSLIGAFGLNTRLQFINELFDGSSESFSEAIKELDNKSDLEQAKVKVGELANQFGWDPEEETVQEFIAYVNRRYA